MGKVNRHGSTTPIEIIHWVSPPGAFNIMKDHIFRGQAFPGSKKCRGWREPVRWQKVMRFLIYPSP